MFLDYGLRFKNDILVKFELDLHFVIILRPPKFDLNRSRTYVVILILEAYSSLQFTFTFTIFHISKTTIKKL